MTTPASGRAASILSSRSRWSAASGGSGSSGGALVGVFEDVGDLGEEQAGGAVDGAAPAGERAVGEPAARVGEQHALGPALDGEAGEAGEVLRDAVRLAERLGDLGLDLGVVDDRVLEQRAGGALGGGLALGGPLCAGERRCVEQAGRARQVLHRAGRAEQRRADVVVDVVERVAAFGVGGPRFDGAVGQPQRAPVGQPVEDVDDGGLVGD